MALGRRFAAYMPHLAAAVLLAATHEAYALQPLETFLGGARLHSPTSLEAEAALAQQDANADAAIGRALPGISLRGGYTRNQYQVELSFPPIVENAVIQPYNQFSGNGVLNVPLIDLASFARIAAAKSTWHSAAAQREATQLQVGAQVAQAYYQLLANVGLVEASQRALEVAKASLELSQSRLHVGSAAVLDVDRAQGDVERQYQQVADAELQLALGARTLETLTAVKPELSTSEVEAAALRDDLHHEQDIGELDPQADAVPALRFAELGTQAAERQALSQRLALVPALSGSFTEIFTNAPGFVPHDHYFQAALSLSWNIDVTALANIRAADAGVAAAKARETRARLDAHDAVFRAWKTVETDIARSRSARLQAKVSAHAAELARDRYGAGTATQLDLLQAQRDAFAADVTRIQADADLINARAQLAFALGMQTLAQGAQKDTP